MAEACLSDPNKPLFWEPLGIGFRGLGFRV